MMKRMMMFAAVAGLALAASAVTQYTVASGETATIGVDIGNTDSTELVAEGASTIVLPAQEGDNCWVFTRLYLTGSGTVTLVAPNSEFSAPTVVFANGLAATNDNVALHVDVACVTHLKVGRSQSSPTALNYPAADIANVTFANPDGIFGLREWATARKLPAVFETGSLRCVALQGKNPLHLTDSLHLTDFDIVALTTDGIPAACTVTVDPGRTFYIKPCSTHNNGDSTYAYKWFWAGAQDWSGLYKVVLGGKGARVFCRNNLNLRLLANISGDGEVVFRPDSSENVYTAFRGMYYWAGATKPIVVPICSATDPEPTTSWHDKVANWFDASDTDSLVKLTIQDSNSLYNGGGRVYTNDFPIILGWKDKVHGIAGTYLYNRRLGANASDYQVQTLPYVVTNGLNGMDYISFGAFNNKVSYPYGKGNNVPEARRLQFHSASTACDGIALPTGGAYVEVSYAYCIMVFGSQQGGGKAILGDKYTTQGVADLARGSSSISQPWLAYATSNGNSYSMLVNGRDINPSTDKPNGGWQIVSLDMSRTQTTLNGIGWHNGAAQGGQNYAEIILFREKPTSAERAACESYLAKKWGLEGSYVMWDVDYTGLSGDGKLTLDDGGWATHEDVTEVTVAGNFAGTIEVPAGKTLVVSDRPAPPSFYDVPQQANLVAWFDPSLDGAIDFNEHPDAATGVARLYSRTTTGVDKSEGAYWMGMNAGATTDSPTGIGNYWGRYPFLVEASCLGAFGVSASMKWMDFTKNALDETNGNTLRSHVLPLTGLEIKDAASTPMTFRSLFMALDTSAGGGNPVGDEVSFAGAIKPRSGNGADYTKPIWSANNTVTMAHTWLDTNEVNGATAGYNGRAEVLGFETATDFTTHRGLFFGYYNPNNSQKNYEHIGETLIYSTTLTDAERLTVQEYLMAKWTGDMNSKYSDLSRATVTGAGNVYSPSLRNLPAFDSGFTGALAGGSNMTFTVDWSWNSSAAVDAITIDRALTLDAGQVTVKLKGEAKAGSYALLTVPSGALAGKTFALTLVNETGKAASAKLVTSDTTLSLEILSDGTVLVLR